MPIDNTPFEWLWTAIVPNKDGKSARKFDLTATTKAAAKVKARRMLKVDRLPKGTVISSDTNEIEATLRTYAAEQVIRQRAAAAQ